MVPDLTAGRAIQTFFLRLPGTTPGIFLFIVFGTTRASRQKIADLVPKSWRESSLPCCGRRRPTNPPNDGGITIQRSLTVTSASRTRASRIDDDEDMSETSDIWLKDLPKRSDSGVSFQIANMKPLPLTPSNASGIRTTITCNSKNTSKRSPVVGISPFRDLSSIDEKDDLERETISRATTNESLQVPDDYSRAEHSDDSGPILPIQRPEVRFAKNVTTVVDSVRQAGGKVRHSRNFSRPKM